MQTENATWRAGSGFAPRQGLTGAGLTFVFGARSALTDPAFLSALAARYPNAHQIGCSTGGQIIADDVSDEAVSCLAMEFARTPLGVAETHVADKADSFEAGRRVGAALARADLRALFVLSDGLNVNGDRLVEGLRAGAGPTVAITGGLAGDGAAFGRTLVLHDGRTAEKLVVAVGFYGDAITIGHGSAGGWSQFGPPRTITRAQDNVLFEIDGKPALALYKSYLGAEADDLPGSGLLYPLLVCDPHKPDHAVVRTILAIDEDAGSMTFAGDTPQGWTAQLMRGYFDRLTAAAQDAAARAMGPLETVVSPKAAILVSCIGRRILMGESIVEEVLAAHQALGAATAVTGFYSYGEISPHAESGACELHNQTMTVTTFAEAA